MTRRECGKTEDVKVKNEPSPADIFMLMCYNRTFNATDCNPIELINCGKSGQILPFYIVEVPALTIQQARDIAYECTLSSHMQGNQPLRPPVQQRLSALVLFL